MITHTRQFSALVARRWPTIYAHSMVVLLSDVAVQIRRFPLLHSVNAEPKLANRVILLVFTPIIDVTLYSTALYKVWLMVVPQIGLNF